MLRAELHCHSSLSYDGRDPVEMVLAQADAVGLDVVAITDHDEIDASLAAANRAEEYGLVGIPGMEVTSEAGHILALGVEELIPPGLSFVETLDRIRDQGGLAVVPHPFQRSRHGVASHVSEETLARADAAEVYNSRLFTGRSNRTAETFLDAIRAGRTSVVGKRTPWRISIRQFGGGVKRRLVRALSYPF
ncbi:phosphoesterase [Halobacteriales archaeon SW_8_65_20]|nr:MAG: phosphoesterase [Halobacteriales archaeon SW_8_65_20]